MAIHEVRRYLFVLGLSALGACFMSASCGGSGAHTPTAPGAPQSNAWSVAGRVFTLDTRHGAAGATVTPNWALKPVTADGNGNYKLSDTDTPASTPLPVTVSGDSLISHDVLISWSRGDRTGVDVGMIHDVPPFSMDFYRQLVRGTYDHTASDGAPFPISRWMSAHSFYVRTVDQHGNAIEPAVVALIVNVIPQAVSAWSAGQYTPGAVETGTDARPQTSGWINVDIKRDAGENKVCGTSLVGENPGSIVLNEGVCDCPGQKGIPGTLIMHEVGHAMGFFHVADTTSIMYPNIQPGCGQGAPTAIEAFHSAIAYSRPRGNTDPDNDPKTGTLAVRAVPTEFCPKAGAR